MVGKSAVSVGITGIEPKLPIVHICGRGDLQSSYTISCTILPLPPSALPTGQREERKKRAVEAIEAIDLIMVDTDPPTVGTRSLSPYI